MIGGVFMHLLRTLRGGGRTRFSMQSPTSVSRCPAKGDRSCYAGPDTFRSEMRPAQFAFQTMAATACMVTLHSWCSR